ncbi:O-methyltransferase hmp5 [Lachnellula arida]|uniref:O-methyltransferase hmp5 n=1 Tax=Lachnellula arida TaxID=1316785 RepID=A0A8T9BFX8_9HELO|nr:O-methyltransferase hmp5 [Lachnellula arida]
MSADANLVASIEALLATAKGYNVDKPDHVARVNMLGQLEALHYQLEDPAEAMFRQLTNYSETSAVRTLRQLNVLEKIPREGSISSKQLAENTGANEEVLTRLIRVLTSTGILKALGGDVYAHTSRSLAFLDTAEVEFWDLCVDEIAPVAYKMPEYVATHESGSIFNPRQSPFSWGNDAEGKTFYEFLLDHPDRLKRFNTAMTTQESALPVLGMFPFTSLLKADADPSRAFIVDVAGGRGQSLLQIKQEIEAAGGNMGKGKVILQDREAVLDAVPDEQIPGVEKMVIDFFQSQPVKNAQIYYLRRIMHNWQDAECRKILQNIAGAMAPDSRLLIGEMVVPDVPEGVDKTVYWMDLCMLIIGGKERSEKEFSALLDSAGLKLIKIWRNKLGSQTVIECHLK